MIRLSVAYMVMWAITYHFCLSAHKIALNNITKNDIYAAVYTDAGVVIAEPFKISARDHVMIDRPYVPMLSGLTHVVGGVAHADDVHTQKASRHDFLLQTTSITDSKVNNITLQSLGHSIGASSNERSSQISLTNTTNELLYVALYYDDGHQALRWGLPVVVDPHHEIKLTRPERKCRFKKLGQCIEFFDSNIYMARTAEDLIPVMKSYRLPHVDAGELKGSEFFFYLNKGQLKGANGAQWFSLSSKKTVVDILHPNIDLVVEKSKPDQQKGKNIVAKATIGKV